MQIDVRACLTGTTKKTGPPCIFSFYKLSVPFGKAWKVDFTFSGSK